MSPKSLLIEWRYPINKDEKSCYGRCYQDRDIFKIFINTHKVSTDEQQKTLLHELMHMFLFIYKRKRIKPVKEEQLCRMLENVIFEVLK